MVRVRWLTLMGVLVALAAPLGAAGFMSEGCGGGKCSDCHTLSADEARSVLGRLVDGVLGVREAEVPGLWEVDVEKRGQKLPVFLDYSKRFVITGDVIDLGTMTSLTRERYIDLNRIDPSIIPLDDAVVLGDPKAPIRIVVFDDPECPFCKKLHPELKKLVQRRPDVAVFIKMLPLKIHPTARKKAEAIICSKSVQMLEDSFAGKPLPEPTCKTDQIEKNERLAKKIGVRSTPTLVFPDGRVVPGYKEADRILRYLEGGTKGKRAAGATGEKAEGAAKKPPSP